MAGPVVVSNQLATDPALGLLSELLFVLSVVFSVVGSLLFGFRLIRHVIIIIMYGEYSLGRFGFNLA